MTESETLFNELVVKAAAGQKGSMFGCPCLKAANGKPAFMYYPKQDQVVFRLQNELLTEALALDGAAVFNPYGKIPMNGWIQVPVAHSAKWAAYAEASLKVAESFGDKPEKKPKAEKKAKEEKEPKAKKEKKA